MLIQSQRLHRRLWHHVVPGQRNSVPCATTPIAGHGRPFSPSLNKGPRMAKPNYAFEKRQKEIAKKKKKEEKLQQKAAQQSERTQPEPQQATKDDTGGT